MDGANDLISPAPALRAEIAARLASLANEMTAEVLSVLTSKYAWINELDAENRSWINLVVRAGVDGFGNWFATDSHHVENGNIFSVAPRSLQRRVTFHQTVDLIRTTIDVVEAQIVTRMPAADRDICRTAIVYYSREVAFDAAEVYARAAEMRGAWDARIEAMVVDSVIRGDVGDSVASRASTLGWHATGAVSVVIGDLPAGSQGESLRRHALKSGIQLLAAPQGDRMVAVVGGDFGAASDVIGFIRSIVDAFGPGPVVVGPLVPDLGQAVLSARAALSGRRAAAGWPGAPRAVLAEDLLPERALSGDGHARRALATQVYTPLHEYGGDLLETLETFLEESSIEATARRLFVHANTVRYRMRKIEELTGYSPSHARDGFALRLGLTLGRLLT